MRFYNTQHRFYCGIDLHAKTMHVCILAHDGDVVFDDNLPCHFETFLKVISPFRDPPCARVPDLVGLIGTRYGSAFIDWIGPLRTLPCGCPHVEPTQNCDRSMERDRAA
jgi:hypothetical protein